MAILENIKVAIMISGQELKEYDKEDDVNDDQSSVSRYFEATSDAEFETMTSAPNQMPCESISIWTEPSLMPAYLRRKMLVGFMHGNVILMVRGRSIVSDGRLSL